MQNAACTPKDYMRLPCRPTSCMGIRVVSVAPFACLAIGQKSAMNIDVICFAECSYGTGYCPQMILTDRIRQVGSNVLLCKRHSACTSHMSRKAACRNRYSTGVLVQASYQACAQHVPIFDTHMWPCMAVCVHMERLLDSYSYTSMIMGLNAGRAPCLSIWQVTQHASSCQVVGGQALEPKAGPQCSLEVSGPSPGRCCTMSQCLMHIP